MEEKLLNISEVTRYLNLSEDRVKELVEKGELPAYKIGGVLLRFKKEQVESYRQKVDAVFIKEKTEFLEHKRSDHKARLEPAEIKYTFLERLEDFLYYNDFYILSFILLALILLAVFGF